MENSRVLVIGGSRNIGYYSAIRLLALGATVTFLLRSPQVFDQDETIQHYIKEGKARLIQGDALVKDDVRRAWSEAQHQQEDNTRPVDFLIFTVGGTPQFSLTKGFTMTPLNLVTKCFINVLETLPSPHPNIIAISSFGITHASRKSVPLLLKPLYKYALPIMHKDKRGMEEAISHSAGWKWDARDSAGDEILGVDWTSNIPNAGDFKNIAVIRPALLTDGECRADVKGSEAYRVKDGDLESSWSVSRKDVAHFLVEGMVKHWQEWEGKCTSIAY
ncbi:uncharacterized protein EDB93DRAFT_862640 [Suillus bovinus]|uniref:uncharacterized protein n=1 Tax=Suillus bovinus TaxID=48563 RepID=UPI001B85DCD9|nr:uncharacterized protein EDB93DRAFT_862640 [Suillus bovinus]KAG2133675.1 hypothetical protein EDB93DRAFT_862640 [Suillus bovinus]